MRIGVNVPDDLHRRMKRIKHTVNISRVCREAIEAYVDDLERSAVRVESDDLDEVIERLSSEEDPRSVDWQELGWSDARDWVKAVDVDRFEHLFHRIDVLRRQGRPTWEVPPPHVPDPDVKAFDQRWGEHVERFARQFERLWEVNSEYWPRADAEEEYGRAWVAYVSAVREKVLKLREERIKDLIGARKVRPEPEAPRHLQMRPGDADRIRDYLCRRVEEARQAGQSTVTFRAGDVHEALGLVSAHPNVCQVLEGKKFHSMAGVELARYVDRPPSGQGANLKIEFRILA